ncbi:hypothetical protein [Treponema sp.]|uniref:hypothetical protein n=1 Tax=Treponema sp. TaxID=166 RepID=UPI00298E3046|nr:hypothetical protein [Treponema sp.]
MNRQEAREWILNNIINDKSLPICNVLYMLGILDFTGTYDFSNDKAFLNALANADTRANRNTISQVKKGNICPKSNEMGITGFDYMSDTDLFGALGGGCKYTWKVTSFDSNKNIARVQIYLEDIFDFNEGNGQRSDIAEKLTTLGRKAGLSTYKINGYYYIYVKVNADAVKKIQEVLQNDK